MTTKQKCVIAAGALAASFAAGRYTLPEKVRIETKIVEVEKKTEKTKTDLDRDKHKETKVTETTNPDGTKTTTTTTVEDTKTEKKTDTAKTDNTQKTDTTVKEVTNALSKVYISALAGIPISLDSVRPIYGASVTKPVIGPITIGVWGLTLPAVGLSVGLSF